jgi:nucleoside-specific outer membrane channel protein Tsx
MKNLLTLCLFIAINFSISAADWSTTSAQYLIGDGFRQPAAPGKDITQATLTFEHASGYKYGDNFFFIDVEEVNKTTPTNYLEYETRLSSSKIFDIKYDGFVKDILLAGQVNQASNLQKVFLYGLGFNLNLPKFNFFAANLFVRDDKSYDGTSYQITLAWSVNFKFGVELEFAGFFDYATEEGEDTSISETNIITQPQLFWVMNKQFSIGIEYHYWKNKYGIDGLDEKVPQLIAKWTL